MSEEIKDKVDETEEIIETETEEQIEEEVKEEEILEENLEEEIEEEIKEVEGNLQELLENPEVQDFIAKIRKQEKDKLYTELGKKDKKIKDLEGEILLAKEQQEAIKEGTLNEQDTLHSTVKELQDKMKNLEDEVKRKELELFKEKALKKAGDDLIIDLVGGDTEEEITNSIELAKTRYQEIVEKAKAKKEGKPVPKATNPAQAPSIKSLTPEEINKMTPKEWAEHREMVKKQMGLTR